MRLHNMLPFRRLFLALALMSSARVANALSQEYCSSQNTGSDFSSVVDIYQSNGACTTTCSEYAFAIVQYQTCWCSNYAPAQQDDTSDCSTNCPGYPQEQCGNTSSDLYGYVAVQGNSPSGTAGGSSSSAPSTSSSTVPSSTPSPSPSSTSQEPETSITSTTPTSTSTSSTSSSTSPSSTPQTTEPATPVTSIIKTTVSGEIVTRTVTSTPVVAPNSGSDSVEVTRNEGLSGGAVAGIVIGVVGGLAAIAAAAFLLWRRKQNAEGAEDAGGAKKNMTRNVSVLSKAGLLSRGAQPSMGERDQDDGYALGSNSVRHSMLFGPGAEGVSPTSPLGSSHGESTSSRRPSKPMVYDQRLNPSALFSNSEANGSRISMQDTQDYSRPLGVMNPDPRPSFESRTSNYHG